MMPRFLVSAPLSTPPARSFSTHSFFHEWAALGRGSDVSTCRQGNHGPAEPRTS